MGGYHDTCGGYHEYHGGCSVPWGTQITKDFPPTVFQKLKPEPLVFWFLLKTSSGKKVVLLGPLHVKHKFSESLGPLFKNYFAFRITSYFSLFTQKNSKTILIRQTLTTGNQWIPSYMYVVLV